MKLVRPIVVDELPHNCKCCEFNQNKYCSALMLMQENNPKIDTFVTNNDDCRSEYCPLTIFDGANDFFFTFNIRDFERKLSNRIDTIEKICGKPKRIQCSCNTIEAWLFQAKLSYDGYGEEVLRTNNDSNGNRIRFKGIIVQENNSIGDGYCAVNGGTWI